MSKFLILAIACLIVACVSSTQSSVNSTVETKILSLTDKTYESTIRTVTLHRLGAGSESTLLPAVTEFGRWSLLLEFDDLISDRDNYSAKIIHCNYDWTKSSLLDLDFISEYNEFPINTFEFSTDTHIPYVHYSFQLPAVKLPGNYVVMVYRGGNKEDVVLTKRFMVHDKRVTFQGERNLVGASSIATQNQQLNFTVNYKNLEILNPLENVKVVIRQNQRWDNVASDVRPSFVREIEKQIEYRFFDDKQMFKGGNEFRFFDLRSLNNPGRNVDRVNKTVKPYEVYIQPDKSRKDEVYSQYLDHNGGFILDNYDYRDISFSNYCYVNFTLASRLPAGARAYVVGAFNQWNRNEENELQLDSATNRYHAKVLLRQGWYDYQYVVEGANQPSYVIEGSHYETENFYEVFFYYKPLQPRADLLIGYLALTMNQR